MIGFEFAGALLLVRLIAAVVFLNLYLRDREGRNLILFSGWFIYAAAAAARFLLTIAPYEAIVLAGATGTGGLAVIGIAALAYVKPERKRFFIPVLIFTGLIVPLFLILRLTTSAELLLLILQAGVIITVSANLIKDHFSKMRPPVPYTNLYLAFGLGILHMAVIAAGLLPSSVTILVTLALNILLMLFFIDAEHSLVYTEIKLSADKIKAYQKSLEQSIEEKDVLIREIHHRVKNNLQIVISILSLKKDGVKDRTARRVMKDMETRLQSMANIHEILLAVDNLASIEISIYLEDLARYIYSLYKSPEWNVKLEVQVEKDVVPVDTAMSCCLIAAECITNACSHAFPEEMQKNRRNLSIRLSYTSEGDSRVLSVYDNGAGLPREYLVPSGSGRPVTKAESAPTLGLILIDSFAAQISGSVERSAPPEGGTCIKVSFQR